MEERYRKILEEIDPSVRRAHLTKTKTALEERFMDTVADLEAQRRLRKRHEKAGGDPATVENLKVMENRVKLMADQLADELERVGKQLDEVKGAGVPKD
jgi:hypothetical protein